MSAIPQAAPAGYWSKHSTIVITWPGDLPGVAAIGRHRRNADGTLSVEYTREDLEFALVAMREFRLLRPSTWQPLPPVDPTAPVLTIPPEPPARVVFGRMGERAGRKLVKQAEAPPAGTSRQEALL